MSDGRFERAIAAIDAANADDPNTITVDGRVRPKEQAHAEMMTEWVARLDLDADEAQLLAARAHHLRRWSIPRSSYPDGRAGYLRWRTALRRQHADEIGELLAGAGYDGVVVERVQQIVGKVGLARDADVQTHEDALCLVFLQTQFNEVADQLGDDHMIEVLAKSLAKMTERGRQVALDLRLTDRQRDLVGRALTEH